MICKKCGNTVPVHAKFCGKCGSSLDHTHSGSDIFKSNEIKCGNCTYTGPGEDNRRLISEILAWCAVVFAPLITIIYFVANPKYRCPKCKSTFVGIKNDQGVYDKPRTNKVFKYIIYTLLGIAALGLISTIIAAPIQNARKKASLQDTWIKYVSTEDSFNVLLPKYPSIEKKENIAIENSESTYAYHEYEAVDGKTSYFIFKYIYSDGINTEDQDKVLNLLVNGMVNATDAKNPVSSFGYYSGYRSVDFSFTAKDEMVKGRAILVGETPYLLMMDYYAENYKEEDYKKFIDSLTINTTQDDSTSSSFTPYSATLVSPAAMRSCPSTTCEVLRYYSETANVKVVGIDATKKWYKINAKDDYGNPLEGWMTVSAF